MRNWLRWFLVAPSMLLAWFLNLQLFYGGIYLFGSFCVPDEFGPWICYEAWYLAATEWLFYFCTALPVFLVILSAVFVAANHKRAVAVIAFLVGVGVGLYQADQGQVTRQVACVLFGGFLGLGVSFRWMASTPVLTATDAAIRGSVA